MASDPTGSGPSSRPLAVAITGGIGAGKSEALAAFARHGAATISSDDIVHRLLQEDEPVREAALSEATGKDLRRLSAMIDEDSRRGVIKNHYKGKGGYFKAAVDIYMHELIARTEERQKAQLRCFAGTTGGVIYDEGTVSSCENLDSIGNLRDYDWNFWALWNSPELNARRAQIKQGCYCTHESNCYYPSLAFNPKHLIQIKKLERQLKKSHPAEARPALEPRTV